MDRLIRLYKTLNLKLSRLFVGNTIKTKNRTLSFHNLKQALCIRTLSNFVIETLAEMSMSGFLRNSCVTTHRGVLALRKSLRFIFTHKMAEKPADHSTTNGFESKTPFLIGVAGGTASGKVTLHLYMILLIFSIEL